MATYDSALEALIDLITDGRTADLAQDLAAKFDDFGVFDKPNATETERQLWSAITELVDAAGEDAEVLVDDAVYQAGYGQDAE
jgi:hypothetical protein